MCEAQVTPPHSSGMDAVYQGFSEAFWGVAVHNLQQY